MFEIEIEPRQDYSHVSGLVNVAKWINDSDEPYFVRLTYDKQGYQAKERVEIEDVPGRSSLVLFGTKKRVEYKPVTRYRDVISGIQLTAPAPCSSVIINLSPKEEVLPWLKIFIVYVFSKSKLTIFFKHEIEKELSWNNRSVQNRNQWKTVNCGLKDTNSIQTTVESSLNSFEKSIIDGFSSDFKVE